MSKTKTIACDKCGHRMERILEKCPKCGELIRDRMDPHVRERVENKMRSRGFSTASVIFIFTFGIDFSFFIDVPLVAGYIILLKGVNHLLDEAEMVSHVWFYVGGFQVLLCGFLLIISMKIVYVNKRWAKKLIIINGLLGIAALISALSGLSGSTFHLPW